MNFVFVSVLAVMVTCITRCDSTYREIRRKKVKVEVYLFPEKYIGPASIIYGQLDGQPTQSRNDTIIFRFKGRDTLITQTPMIDTTVFTRRIYAYELADGRFKELTITGCVSCTIPGVVVFQNHGVVWNRQQVGSNFIVDSLKNLYKYIDMERAKQW